MKIMGPRQRKSLRVIGMAVALSVGVASVAAHAQTSAAPSTAAPTAPGAVPTAEVSAKSSEVTAFLAAIARKFAPSDEIQSIKRAIPGLTQQIDLAIADTSAILGDQPPLATLQAQHSLWQRKHQQISDGLAKMTQRAAGLREALGRLENLWKSWTLTRDGAQYRQAPASIQGQIETTLAAIEASQSQLNTQEEEALGILGELARELTRCDGELTIIAKAQKSTVEGFFDQENSPIWAPELWDNALSVLPGRMQVISHGFWLNIMEYLRDPSRGMPLHVMLFAVLTAAACAARHKKRRWTADGICVPSAMEVFDRPYSTALIIALLVATATLSSTPERVKDVLSALTLVPMTRLIRPATDPRLAPGVFAAVGLYLLDLVRQSLGGAPLIEQAILMLESLATIAALSRLLDGERLRLLGGSSPDSVRARSVPWLIKGLILFGIAGFLSATVGYTRLARLMTPGILYGSVLALSLYAFVRVISGAVAIALRGWPLQKLHMVVNHCDLIERRISRVLSLLAAVSWVNRSIDYVGLLDLVRSGFSAILDFKLERQSISVSVEDVLFFGLTVWASYLLSAFIRFALQEELYPRRGIGRGLSYAYSRVIHYIVLTLGFLVGLGVLGMDLTKVTVLAGALGVGIGFGLQEVVNNFVCGLILLFERPVNAGDIVEVNGLQAEVRRIGIRASTIRTYQGADLVVPNSQFITATVTNWTLSDQMRRLDLPVVVNCKADPEKTINLLLSTARAIPRILQDPAPECLFTGYGDNSVSFDLRGWTNQENWAAVRSELMKAVYHAVCALQREVSASVEHLPDRK